MVSRIQTYSASNDEDLHVSLLIKTYGCDELRKQNEILIKNALNKLVSCVEERDLSKKLRNRIVENANKLVNTIDLKKIKGSVGLYVSCKYLKIIYFDTILSDKILMGDSFEIKSTLLSELSHLPYYLVTLSENYVRLYEGAGLDVTEIKNVFLPFHIKDKFEHERNKNLLSKSPEETDIDMKRLTAELNIVENKLHKLIGDKKTPLLVCGKDKMLSSFKMLGDSHWPNSYYFELSFEKTPANEVGKFGSLMAQQLYEARIENILGVLDNKSNDSMFITDIKDIWYAANEGKGDKLFLDKTLSIPAKIHRSTGEIFIDDLDKLDEQYETISDIIELVIEKVMLNHGKVYFLSENKLDKYGKTVMSLRYTGKQHPIN